MVHTQVCPQCGAGPNLFDGSTCERCRDIPDHPDPIAIVATVALGLAPLGLLLLALFPAR